MIITLHISLILDNSTVGDIPKLSVRLYLHATGVIAAKFPYHMVFNAVGCFFSSIILAISFLDTVFARYLWRLFTRYPKLVGMEKKGCDLRDRFLYLSCACCVIDMISNHFDIYCYF